LKLSEFQETKDTDEFYDSLKIKKTRSELLEEMKDIIKRGKSKQESDQTIKESIRCFLLNFKVNDSVIKVNKEVDEFMNRYKIK
jgi:hypothetical protein